MIRNFLLSLLVLFTLSFTLPAEAQRYALVIGNSDYQQLGTLKNPINDANDMGQLLEEQGFNVTILTNADKRKMQDGISAFTHQLHQKGSVGLFYFAGHGMQIDGRNYLVPVNVHINTESDVEYESVDAGRVLAGMRSAGNNLNMVILDACRNNPFARSFRSSTKGLARMDAAKGTLILYAASAGEVASDGKGRNGLFTSHLMSAIKTPGLKVEDAFKKTALAVYQSTDNKQLPWQAGVILGDFYFNNEAPKTETITIASSETADKQVEIEFWNSIKNSQNPAYIQAYLNKFGDSGLFNSIAIIKLNELTKQAEPEDSRVIDQNIAPPAQYEIETNEISTLIKQYISASNDKNMDDVLSLYADNIDYFSVGSVSRSFISKDKRNYYKRWPNVKIKFVQLIDNVTLGEQEVRVKFLIQFNAYSRARHQGVKGLAENTFILKNEHGNLKIIGENQRVIKREKYKGNIK